MDRGNWLIVQNCNFSDFFLNEIENLLEQSNENWSSNFRLWLIFNENVSLSQPFPVSLLLRSLIGKIYLLVFAKHNYLTKFTLFIIL